MSNNKLNRTHPFLILIKESLDKKRISQKQYDHLKSTWKNGDGTDAVKQYNQCLKKNAGE